jgi:DNA modification methylase
MKGMSSATIRLPSQPTSIPSEVRTWSADRLAAEAVQAIRSCRAHGQAAAQSAWRAGAYLSLLHARLTRGRRWATWLRQQEDLISEDTARRYILLYERTGGIVAKLDGMTLCEAYVALGIARFTEVRIAAYKDRRQEDDQEDEEEILRAAAQIRQRRVAERLKQIQERRRQSQPVLLRKRGGPVLHGDCLDLIPTLEDGSVSLVVTSPPYAEQRAGYYGGIPEEDYPDFTVQWMSALAPKMTPDGSVFLVIRPHVKNGVLSDYVMRTRLALREAGWHECEELIWLKPDAPPLGSLKRPRRTWESLLWFSRSTNPYADLKACGRESGRVGFDGSLRFGAGNGKPLNGGQAAGCTTGVARISDVLLAPIGTIERGLDHPAVFPLALAEQLVRTFSQLDDLVLDPFCGSGQALLAAKECGRRYLGIEREERYVKIALGRLR